MISRTCTGAAAWRKVPQVVATGNARVVTRNVIPATSTTGRSARSRACQGSAPRPEDAIGMPEEDQHVEDVVAQALDPHLHEARGTDREVPRRGWAGRSRRRCRSPSRTGRSRPPGPAAGCRRRPSPAGAHGAKMSEAHRRHDPDQPDALGARRSGPAPGEPGPDQREPGRLVARQRGRAQEQPQRQAGAGPRAVRHADRAAPGPSAGRHPGRARRTASWSPAGPSAGPAAGRRP